ncbi:T9SS type A sorting domain-containing protein [Adhaeribacter terreus]|uniref:T9SS type A sorting domain-containing protein n=1 Tax=Adhaeribacter terreus TaxID=529703 RepID=A0ABW0E9F8_9BACT
MLLLALFCFSGFYGNAQSWNWVSHNNFGPRELINVVADQNGYIYASGFDGVGNKLTKYKPDGTMIWSKDSVGRIQELSVDTAGNLYIVAGFGCGYGCAVLGAAKLDSAGNAFWTKGILAGIAPADGFTDFLFAGATDSAGNTYVSGSFVPRPEYDTISLSNLAPNNYYLAKYNSVGKIQWLKFFNDPIYAIACGPQGSYFIECGTYFQKYGGNDSLIWQQNFSGTFNPSVPYIFHNKLVADAQGNLFVVGNKLAKYNSNGTLAWIKNVAGKDLALTHSGNIVVTGSFNGSLILGNGVPDLTAVTANQNLFVAQFSEVDGSANWAKQAGTSGWNSGDAIVSLPNGNCVIAGDFNSGSTFDQHTFTGNGFFVAELNTTLLGISENNSKTNFQLYPNPATSEITLSNPDFRNATVQLFNVAGQKMLEINYPAEGNLKVATENWPAGLYVVKVTAKGKSYHQKFMVQH